MGGKGIGWGGSAAGAGSAAAPGAVLAGMAAAPGAAEGGAAAGTASPAAAGVGALGAEAAVAASEGAAGAGVTWAVGGVGTAMAGRVSDDAAAAGSGAAEGVCAVKRPVRQRKETRKRCMKYRLGNEMRRCLIFDSFTRTYVDSEWNFGVNGGQGAVGCQEVKRASRWHLDDLDGTAALTSLRHSHLTSSHLIESSHPAARSLPPHPSASYPSAH